MNDRSDHPPRRLQSIPGGCRFRWASDRAERAAAELASRFPTNPGPTLDAMVRQLQAGRLKERIGRKPGDYKLMETRPVYELRIETTLPRFRLYFVERNGPQGLYAVGLKLATKPTGSAEAQRAQQNRDIEDAWAEVHSWRYPPAES